MPFWHLDATARAAWAAATSKTGQLTGLRDVWSGQAHLKHYKADGTLLATVVHATPVVDTVNWELVPGAYVSQTVWASGVAAYCVWAVPGGADILRADSAWDAADPTISSPGGRVRLDIGSQMGIQATSTLPVVDLPSYISTAAVHEWVAIPNSTFQANGSLNGRFAYSNLAIAGTLAVIGPMGGHQDSADNSVHTFDLSAATGWVQRKASGWNGSEQDVAYYADGSPASRHTYNTGHYSEVHARVIFHGTPVAYGSAVSFLDSNGFNLATDSWDAGGTWSDVVSPALCKDADGNCWSISDAPTRKVHKWIEATDTWVDRFNHNDGSVRPYGPMAHDSTRNELFCLREFNGSLKAVRLTSDGTVADNIIIDSSAALTAFRAEAFNDATMCHDEENDRYLLWGEDSSVLYAVMPTNNTTGWSMSTVTTTGATVPASAGAMGRLLKVLEWKAIIVIPNGDDPMYAMRYA